LREAYKNAVDWDGEQRDRFAAAALTGILAKWGEGDPKEGAEIAYGFATAMMKRRAEIDKEAGK